MFNLAILFLEGKSDEVLDELQKKMEEASQELDYEQLHNYRDQITSLTANSR